MIKGILRSSFQFLWQTTLRNIFCFASINKAKEKELFKQDIVDVMDQILSNIPDAVQI